MVPSEALLGTDYFLTQFEPTPIMSTYTLAFVVSNYITLAETVEPITGKKLRIIGRNELKNDESSKLILQNSMTLIVEYSKYFNFDYFTSISKMDQVILPELGPQAMENWGLITYRNGRKSAFKFSSSDLISFEGFENIFSVLIS
jgi:aminopeptidase N